MARQARSSSRRSTRIGTGAGDGENEFGHGQQPPNQLRALLRDGPDGDAAHRWGGIHSRTVVHRRGTSPT